MNILLTLLLTLTTHAHAADCREESLVHFYSQGQEINSELIGAEDPCDDFGGNRIHSPKYDLYLYVNFNIAGTVNVDELEAAYAASPFPKRRLIQLAVVRKGWIKEKYGDDREAVLSLGQDILFISAPVLEEGRFTALMRDFYGSASK